ncbi:hypothetical protein FRC08_017160 [Ceratobasidium sp. 394]|nr:hypothetical protein FRC08_017160 [Ceratobasidium sp. 394]
MRLHSTVYGVGLLAAGVVSAGKNGLPVDKVYGVNVAAAWQVAERTLYVPKGMTGNGWRNMQRLPEVHNERIASLEPSVLDEVTLMFARYSALVQKLGQTQADKVFAKHWSTWFTQANVDTIANAGLNTVRIPLGYWIIEPLVNRSTEFYPRGGFKYLKQGVRMLKAKGLHVLLDLHALPSVASANQMFAGCCTTDVQFYVSYPLILS